MSPRIGLDRQMIVQAAAEIADTQGTEAVTLAAVAKKLNIRTPSLYNHVDGLPGLRQLLSLYGLEQMYEKLDTACGGRSGDDAVRALAKAYLEFARTRPGIYELTLRAPDPQQPEVAAAGERLVGLLVRILDDYGLTEEEALHTVRGLRSILHGFASLERVGGFRMPLDLDESFRLLVDSYLAGIRAIRKQGPAT